MKLLEAVDLMKV